MLQRARSVPRISPKNGERYFHAGAGSGGTSLPRLLSHERGPGQLRSVRLPSLEDCNASTHPAIQVSSCRGLGKSTKDGLVDDGTTEFNRSIRGRNVAVLPGGPAHLLTAPRDSSNPSPSQAFVGLGCLVGLRRSKRRSRASSLTCSTLRTTAVTDDVASSCAANGELDDCPRSNSWTGSDTSEDSRRNRCASDFTSPQDSLVNRCASDFSGDFQPQGGKITEWQKGPRIGRGSFGCVYKAQNLLNGCVFAVKQTVIQGDEERSKDVAKLQMEIDICSNLRHRNIVSYLGYSDSDGRLSIFLEYVAGGSMAHYISCFGCLNSNVLGQATQDCLEGLHYLHSCSPPVVHRDLKCANLLVDLDFCVKLTDFGCSKRSDDTTSFTTIGSVPWMAPEVIQGACGHGRKADIWSLGCTVLEMATSEKPWGNMFDNVMAALRYIGMNDCLPNVPDFVPVWCQNFLKYCLQRSPSDRPHTGKLQRKLAALRL